MVYSRGRVLDRGGLEIRHRGSSEARGEDTDESGDSAEREQIGGLYLLDIGGHEFRESVRRTFRIADTPGIGAVGARSIRVSTITSKLGEVSYASISSNCSRIRAAM